jgi:hypothetical protein
MLLIRRKAMKRGFQKGSGSDGQLIDYHVLEMNMSHRVRVLRKCGSAGNRTRASGSVGRNSGHQSTEVVYIRVYIYIYIYIYIRVYIYILSTIL